MSKRHIRYTRQQWQQMIQDQADSGLSINQWCRRRNVGLSTFSKWKRRFDSSGTEDPTPKGSRFIELTNKPEALPMVLRIGGNFKIEINSATPVIKVAELVRALQHEC